MDKFIVKFIRNNTTDFHACHSARIFDRQVFMYDEKGAVTDKQIMSDQEQAFIENMSGRTVGMVPSLVDSK